jgi:hypothetical protein
MRAGVRRGLSLLAIYAVALHTILWVAIVPAATATIDPSTVICHSDSGTIPAEQTPSNSHLIPAHACDHCNLCSATASPAALDTAQLAQLVPAQLILLLHPASLPRRDGIAASPHLARGPPSFA